MRTQATPKSNFRIDSCAARVSHGDTNAPGILTRAVLGFRARVRRVHLGIGFAALLAVFVVSNLVTMEAAANIRAQTFYIDVSGNSQLSAEETDALIAPGRLFEVQRGDTLATIFKRAGLGAAAVHNVVNDTPDGDALTKILPGEKIRILAKDGELLSLSYELNPIRSLEIHATPYGLESYYIDRQPEIELSQRNGTIHSSLFVDAEAVGVSRKIIMELAGIFGWDIDFALDIRQGDTFNVLYEQQYLDDQLIGDGPILVAEFVNQGEVIRAVRYVDSNGEADYYTPEGESMRKTFLRAPVDFTRISSNFNPNRLHPVFKTVRPHNGIDYAAATGTPVFASGDGKVIASAFSEPNGNYVFIQHGQTYVTKYLHLNKRSVKAGQTVRQGQVIGTVGSTGYATGPHLHYEFLVNGVHMNPRTVELPNGQPIDSNEMDRFLATTQPVVAMLDPGEPRVALQAP